MVGFLFYCLNAGERRRLRKTQCHQCFRLVQRRLQQQNWVTMCCTKEASFGRSTSNKSRWWRVTDGNFWSDALIIDTLAVGHEETCATIADDNCISDCHKAAQAEPTSSAGDQETRCNLSNRSVFCIDKFIDNDRIILYYTGFKTFEQFMLLLNVLGPCTYNLPVKSVKTDRPTIYDPNETATGNGWLWNVSVVWFERKRGCQNFHLLDILFVFSAFRNWLLAIRKSCARNNANVISEIVSKYSSYNWCNWDTDREAKSH